MRKGSEMFVVISYLTILKKGIRDRKSGIIIWNNDHQYGAEELKFNHQALSASSIIRLQLLNANKIN